MDPILFNRDYWPNDNLTTRTQWKKANCFIGLMHGWFFFNSQAYIVGQVLAENRVYDDQVYRMFANGNSRVEFQPMVSQS